MEKIAIVGFGYVARTLHVPVWVAQSDVTVCAVVDQRSEACEAARAEYGVKTYATVYDLLRTGCPDIAVVATDAENRINVVLPLLVAGAHVICEKPFALTLSEADQMVSVAKSCRLHLAVHHQSCFSESFECTKQHITDGLIGTLYGARIFSKGRLAPYDLREMVGHQLHWLYEVCGAPHRVQASIFEKGRRVRSVDDVYVIKHRHPAGRPCGLGIGDQIVAQYYFKDGVIGDMHLVTINNDPSGAYSYAGVEFLGLLGRIKVFESQTFYNPSPLDTPDTLGRWELIAGSLDTPYGMDALRQAGVRFARDFLSAVRTGSSPRVSADVGLDVLEMTLAPFYANRSPDGSVNLPIEERVDVFS